MGIFAQKRVPWVLAAAALFLLLAAWVPVHAQEGSHLRVGIEAEPGGGWDLHVVPDAAAGQVMFNVMQGLLGVNAEGSLVPLLAEDWEISGDGLEYTFYLREGVLWHNGREFTAEDVAFSIDRILDPDTGHTRRSDYDAITEVEVVDDYTVKLITDRLDAGLLAALAQAGGVMVPEEAVDDLANEPVGTGPYRFVEWSPGSHIVLERFDDYWGELPEIQRATFRFITDPPVAVAALRAGDIDVIARMAPATAAEVEAEPDLYIVSEPQNLPQIMAINNAREPLDDVRVRQAIAHAVDREQIIEVVMWGFGTPIGTHMTPVLADWYNPATEELNLYDPDRARELLAEAGYPDGFTVSMELPEPFTVHRDTGEFIADQLSRVGIDVEIEIVEWGYWVSEVYGNRQYELTVIGHTGRLDPDALVSRYHSEHDVNYFNYSNPRVDELLERGPAVVDLDERREIYNEVQYLIAEEVAALHIMDPHILSGLHERVSGWQIYPIYVVDLTTVTIDG